MRIIYFDIDCLRPDHLGCYGYNRPTSPTIDSIARQGTRFNHYYCASSPCLPSRTALMSGRFGIRNGCVSNHGAGADFNIDVGAYGGPRPDSMPFPRQLRKHGYDTICFSNFADRHYAMWWMCGWSEFHTPNLKCGGETAAEVNEKVLPWLKVNGARDDYYLHINYWDTHRCYKMDEKWSDRFKDSPVTAAWPDEAAIKEHQSVTGLFTANRQFKDGVSNYPLMPDGVRNRADYEKMITAYDTSIAFVDHHIQQILDELESQELLEDTAVIISGDHGDAFGEHGVYSDHVNIDECVQRIPLVVKWPGVTAGEAESDSFMYNVDFAPTVCDLLGIDDRPAEWDGTSFKENVAGNPGHDRDHLVWDSGLYTVQRAVRTKQHLYIRTFDAKDYNNWKKEELYDMTADPYQTTDLSGTLPDKIAECRTLMEEWVREQMAKPHAVQDPLEAVLEERKESK